MAEPPAEPPPQDWPDAAGRVVHGVHLLPVRVYYEDTDFSGIVYHANYLRYCERGRSDLLRLIGIGHGEMADGAFGGPPLHFAVTRMEIAFLAPARIDDLMEVRTAIAEIGRARFVLDQRVSRGADELFRARVTAAVLDAQGRPQRLPAAIREALATL